MLRTASFVALAGLKQTLAAGGTQAVLRCCALPALNVLQREMQTAKQAQNLAAAAAVADEGFKVQTATPSSYSSAGYKADDSYMLMHPVYDKAYLETVRPMHRPPVKLHEKVGYNAVHALRAVFDWATGYGTEMNERKWLQRMIYLESVAGVPGMVAGMLRHLRSLRTMRRDHGWIHTLLEEAENERMHLLTFLKLRQPGILFRSMVLLGQGVFFNAYVAAYIISPKSCHSFVGYLEEEATKTYTRCIEDIDAGKLKQWEGMAAPEIAKKYWRLEEGATMRDLMLAVRADEACHNYVNHAFAQMDADDSNPFTPGSVHLH